MPSWRAVDPICRPRPESACGHFVAVSLAPRTLFLPAQEAGEACRGWQLIHIWSRALLSGGRKALAPREAIEAGGRAGGPGGGKRGQALERAAGQMAAHADGLLCMQYSVAARAVCDFPTTGPGEARVRVPRCTRWPKRRANKQASGPLQGVERKLRRSIRGERGKKETNLADLRQEKLFSKMPLFRSSASPQSGPMPAFSFASPLSLRPVAFLDLAPARSLIDTR